MKQHSTRMANVQSPVIPLIAERIRASPGTISLGQGVVSYGPPPAAAEALSSFWADPRSHLYGSVAGIAPLLGRITDKLQSDNNIRLDGQGTDSRSRVMVTAGSNMAFMTVVLAITAPGDEIILLAPFYFNHDMAIAIAGCKTVVVPTDASYQLDVAAIERAITPRTRAVVSVSPNNPTGAVYSEASLRDLSALCRSRGVYLMSDEAYEYFTYNGARHFSPGSIAGAQAHTISLFSLSKTYGLASWRIGFMVIPEHLNAAVEKVQDTNLICAPVISQHAAAGALSAGRAYCDEKVRVLADVRATVLRALGQLRGKCDVPEPHGAFYAFVRLHTEMDCMDLVGKLIDEYKVAAIPGDTFGMTNGRYLRVAYGALQPESVIEGIGRLVRGLDALIT